jgi:hypothetical protein
MATQTTGSGDAAPTERIVEREVPVQRDSGGNATAVIFGFILLAAVIIGAVFLINYQRDQTLRTSAVSGAASSVAKSVDNAANSVGNAANNAANAVTPSK